MAGFRRVPTSTLLFLSGLLLLGAKPGYSALTDVEKEFVKVPSPDGARDSLKFITSKPHVAGTPGDHEVSRQTRTTSRFREAVQPLARLLSRCWPSGDGPSFKPKRAPTWKPA